MSSLDAFSDILQHDKPLAPLTWMNLGGLAQFFLEPRDQAELQKVVTCCHENGIPIFVLGSGSNLLVRDEGVSGAVIHLANASFAEASVDGTTLRSGAGALLSQAISVSVRDGLAGLEVLAGIPGTVESITAGKYVRPFTAKIPVATVIVSSAFIVTPASKMKTRAHAGFDSNQRLVGTGFGPCGTIASGSQSFPCSAPSFTSSFPPSSTDEVPVAPTR